MGITFESDSQDVDPKKAPSRARQLVHTNDTLFSCVRVYLENVARVPQTLDQQIASTAFAVLRPADGIDPGYLFWLTRRSTFIHEMTEAQRGNSPPAVLESEVKSATVPIAPTAEQSRIAAKIDELFGEIEAGEQELEQARQGLAAYRRAVLKAAVTGELTRDWREANAPNETGQDFADRILKTRRRKLNSTNRRNPSEPVPPDAEFICELPRGWTWMSLDQVSVKMTSGSRAWSRFYDRGNSIFIMAQNVRPGRFDASYRQLVDPPLDDPERRRTLVARDDLLVTIVGANTGDVCRLNVDLEDHYVCQSVALIRPVDSFLSEYLELFFIADEGAQRQFRKHIYGAGRPHLSFDQLRAIAISLPPEREQRQIVSLYRTIADVIDELNEQITAAAVNASQLRQSVLSAAFSGRLVRQEAGDEPASALLKCLRMEHDGTTRGRPKKRANADRGTAFDGVEAST